MAKLSLQAQIAEVRRELAERETRYRDAVKYATMRAAEADYYTNAMQSVMATLEFMQEHEAIIRQAIAKAKDGKR